MECLREEDDRPLHPRHADALRRPHIGRRPSDGLARGAQDDCALLPLDRAFYLLLTGHATLVFTSRLRGLSKQEATVDAPADELQLSESWIGASTEMPQKFAIARGAAGLLLLEEPTRSLDDAAIELMWTALERRPLATALIATRCTATQVLQPRIELAR
jgi:ABC-type multidrug transport system ATPase subunit